MGAEPTGLDLADSDGFPAVLDALWPAEVAAGRVDDLGLRRRFDAMGQRHGPDVFRRQQEAIIARADSRPDLAGVGVPTLAACGRDDAITPLDGHEEMAAGIPGTELVVLDDCGHLSTWERPEQVTAALRARLARGACGSTRWPDPRTTDLLAARSCAPPG